MGKYWLMFIGFYLAGGISLALIDWAYVEYKKRRQAKILAGRLSLLREFAQKTRDT